MTIVKSPAHDAGRDDFRSAGDGNCNAALSGCRGRGTGLTSVRTRVRSSTLKAKVSRSGRARDRDETHAGHLDRTG